MFLSAGKLREKDMSTDTYRCTPLVPADVAEAFTNVRNPPATPANLSIYNQYWKQLDSNCTAVSWVPCPAGQAGWGGRIRPACLPACVRVRVRECVPVVQHACGRLLWGARTCCLLWRLQYACFGQWKLWVGARPGLPTPPRSTPGQARPIPIHPCLTSPLAAMAARLHGCLLSQIGQVAWGQPGTTPNPGLTSLLVSAYINLANVSTAERVDWGAPALAGSVRLELLLSSVDPVANTAAFATRIQPDWDAMNPDLKDTRTEVLKLPPGAERAPPTRTRTRMARTAPMAGRRLVPEPAPACLA